MKSHLLKTSGPTSKASLFQWRGTCWIEGTPVEPPQGHPLKPRATSSSEGAPLQVKGHLLSPRGMWGHSTPLQANWHLSQLSCTSCSQRAPLEANRHLLKPKGHLMEPRGTFSSKASPLDAKGHLLKTGALVQVNRHLWR